jgi:sRNA-binding protein
MGAVGQIAEVMGWTVSYTRGALTPWKMSAVYCQAVLAHDQRIALDGTPAEPVDAEARDQATKRLAHLAARNAAKKAAAPIETPVLRDRVRAGLLRRRA